MFAAVVTEIGVLLRKSIRLLTEMRKKTLAELGEPLWKPKDKNSPPTLARDVLIPENRSFTEE
jgi:hypothetical protein